MRLSYALHTAVVAGWLIASAVAIVAAWRSPTSRAHGWVWVLAPQIVLSSEYTLASALRTAGYWTNTEYVAAVQPGALVLYLSWTSILWTLILRLRVRHQAEEAMQNVSSLIEHGEHLIEKVEQDVRDVTGGDDQR